MREFISTGKAVRARRTPTSSEIVDSVVQRSRKFAHLRQRLGDLAHVVLIVDEAAEVLDVSDELELWLGYCPSAVIGQSAFDFIHPADRHMVGVELLRELEEPHRNAQSIVTRIRHFDGHYLEMELFGSARVGDPTIAGLLVSLRDVTGRRTTERAIAAGDYLFAASATVAADATTIFDNTGRMVYASPSLDRMLGYSRDELFQLVQRTIVHPDDQPILAEALTKVLENPNGSARLEGRAVRSDGTTIWLECTVVNLLDTEEVRGIVIHCRNISERRRFDDEMRRRAHEDSLTGLDNRLAFIETLHAGHPVTSDSPLTVLFCDLDGFKQINDQYGHAAGDLVLQRVAASIRGVIRPCDYAARMGGDEFCISSRELSSADEATKFAERVRDAIINTATPGEPVGVSIGVMWSDTPEASSEILIQADHAMYAVKRRGRNLIGLA